MKRALTLLILSLQIILANSQHMDEVFDNLDLEEKKEIVISELLQDTINFSTADLHHLLVGTTYNKNSYSKLFVINGRRYFVFDIVGKDCVEEFITVYLVDSKIKSITKLSSERSTALFGTKGENGAIFIWVKSLKKRNTSKCGFKFTKGGSGNNFDQWIEGDLRAGCRMGN